jgi:hypothetical protein
LQDNGFLTYEFGKKRSGGRPIEALHTTPRPLGYIHIFRMGAGATAFGELGLEDIQESSLLSICIGGFSYGEAAGNLPADQPDPLFCDKTDSRNTAMVMLVGVGETKNPVGTHGVGLTFRL